MENKKNKKRWLDIVLIVGICVLIAFVVVTSIVINNKRKDLDNLEQQIEQMENSSQDQENLAEISL